mmetsp:Transcript_47006/g.114692  ORF Transcript_47006/g.114692 Transcript_47006/m.114692 type:complete len:349 (-) Transcript_47006:119-1165(-)
MSPSSTTSTTSGSSDSPSFEASTTTLIVGRTKDDVKTELCQTVARISKQAIQARHKFVVALSGGSLPSMLDGLVALNEEGSESAEEGSESKSAEDGRLQFGKWWILLADERVVPLNSPDSNLGSIHKHFLSKVNIPPSQIIGINQSLLQQANDNTNSDDVATSLVADDYETQLKTTNVLGDDQAGDNGKIDLALLGFGPDGHTCSLFPGHALLTEKSSSRLVAPIMDSPKLPPHRITLTLKALDASHTRNIVVCGTGTSKYPIIKDVFDGGSLNVEVEEEKNTKKKQDASNAVADVPAIQYYTNVRMVPLSKTTYPSAMVGRRVSSDASTTTTSSSLTWLIDQDALDG